MTGWLSWLEYPDLIGKVRIVGQHFLGRLAQLVRARGSHPRGQRFESPTAHHNLTVMFFTFVLQSIATGRFYIGSTEDALNRLDEQQQ